MAHDLTGAVLCSLSSSRQEGDDGSALLKSDDRVRLQGCLDLSRDAAGQLATRVKSVLELVTVKVGNIEDSDAVLPLGIHAV